MSWPTTGWFDTLRTGNSYYGQLHTTPGYNKGDKMKKKWKTEIVIVDDCYGGYSRYPDEDSQYDSGTQFTEHCIRGFKIANKHEYRDLVVSFVPKKNKPYYLVYAIYDTGDSFGRDDGKIVFFDLFDNIEVAEANEKILNGITKDKVGCCGSVIIFDNEFKPYKTSVPWTGYFECLQDVYVETVYLEGKHGKRC